MWLWQECVLCSEGKCKRDLQRPEGHFRNEDYVFKTFHKSCSSGYGMNTEQFWDVFLGDNDSNYTQLFFRADTKMLYISAYIYILCLKNKAITPSSTACNFDQLSFILHNAKMTWFLIQNIWRNLISELFLCKMRDVACKIKCRHLLYLSEIHLCFDPLAQLTNPLATSKHTSRLFPQKKNE